MKRLLAAAACLLPALVLADVEMQYSDNSIALVHDGNVLIGDTGTSVLIRADDDAMILIDHRERSWIRLEPGFMEAMVEQMRAQMAPMLAGMPPEQRAMVEAQMSAMLPTPGSMPELVVERTGRTEEVAGYQCEVVISRNPTSGAADTFCVASARELDISADDFEAMAAAMDKVAELMSMSPNAAPSINVRALGGIPVNDSGSDSSLVSVETGAVDASRLQVPDGYREASLEELMGQ